MDDPAKARLEKVLRPIFKRYDTSGDGNISALELIPLLQALGEKVSSQQAEDWMHKLDPDQSGEISIDEFTVAMLNYIKEKMTGATHTPTLAPRSSVAPVNTATLPAAVPDYEAGAGGGGDEEEEEEEEMPEEYRSLTPEQQQSHIKKHASFMMGMGTLLILVFSDPMVDVMSNVGARINVKPFYVAFVLAPLASNASEFIASYSYAKKKTKKTITVALSSLVGAACMNNTFCLAIFMALISASDIHIPYGPHTLTQPSRARARAARR